MSQSESYVAYSFKCMNISCGAVSRSLHRCSNCYRASYCSVACQTAHWRYHEPVCFDKESPISSAATCPNTDANAFAQPGMLACREPAREANFLVVDSSERNPSDGITWHSQNTYALDCNDGEQLDTLLRRAEGSVAPSYRYSTATRMAVPRRGWCFARARRSPTVRPPPQTRRWVTARPCHRRIVSA